MMNSEERIFITFEDDNGKIFETGNILYADLNLRGQNNSFYYFKKKGSEGHYDNNGAVTGYLSEITDLAFSHFSKSLKNRFVIIDLNGFISSW